LFKGILGQNRKEKANRAQRPDRSGADGDENRSEPGILKRIKFYPFKPGFENGIFTFLMFSPTNTRSRRLPDPTPRHAADISLPADMDVILATTSCRELIARLAELPPQTDIQLDIGAGPATVPSVQLLLSAHRSVSATGHNFRFGQQAAAVIASSTLPSPSPAGKNHGKNSADGR